MGDAASTELSDRLSTASNLLAHHLKILQTAGLIERHRSEGDGRRSYWRLVRRAFEPFGSPTIETPERIVFVCTANTARSHLAAAMWREESPIPAASAGTHPAERIAPGAVAAARRHHLELPDVRPQHLDTVASDGDLVVTVCDLAHEELGTAVQLHWSIPDPVGLGTKAAFDRAYDELAARVRLLAPLLNRAS
ncbi:helix-turn-helix domain-containing protein [Nocardioides hungaricus]